MRRRKKHAEAKNTKLPANLVIASLARPVRVQLLSASCLVMAVILNSVGWIGFHVRNGFRRDQVRLTTKQVMSSC